MANNEVRIEAFNPLPQGEDEDFDEEEWVMLQQMHEIYSPGTFAARKHMQVDVAKIACDTFQKAAGAQTGIATKYAEAVQTHQNAQQYGSHGVKSDSIDSVEEMRTQVEEKNELKVSKEKVESQKPSKGIVILVSTAAAVLFTIFEALFEILPKYRAGEVSVFYVVKELCWRVSTTAAQAGGIGVALAILEELSPKIAQAAGPFLIVGSILLVAIPAVRKWCKNESTFGEMSTTILKAISANGLAYGGALLGAGMASVAGPIGTIIGGCIGGWLGAHVGSWIIDIGTGFFSWLRETRPTETLIDSLTIHYAHRQSVPFDPDARRLLVNGLEGGCWGFGKTDPTILNDQRPHIERALDKHMRQFALRWHPDKNPGHEQEAQLKFISACQNVERLKYMLYERIGFEHRRVLEEREGMRGQIADLERQNQDKDARIQDKDARIADKDARIAFLEAQLAANRR